MPGKLPENTMFNILKALPVDMTYIDAGDIIRYYSDYRIFKRTPDIIGTAVQKCHKHGSWDEVNKTIDDLRSGRQTISEHPAEKNGRKVRVRYIAVKDDEGKYAGLVETVEWAD